MIRFDHVTKSLSGRPVLDDVTFEVEEGESFVVVGPSGAGKSVTLKHMLRLLRPDQGEVSVDGEVINDLSGPGLERLRSRFGMLFQSSALLEWLTVAENVALPLREKTHMREEEIRARVSEKLGMVGLGNDAEKHPSELSGGMRKRAGLARALVENPAIILYDEPTSGLDPVTSRTIDELIDRTRRELNVTTVVVTHDLHSALGIGTRIVMLDEGRIEEIATPAAFIKSNNEKVRAFLAAQYISRAGPWEDAR